MCTSVDTVHLGRLFDVTGGIRYDYFYTQQRQYTASTKLNPFIYRIDRKPSYRAAFVYKPNAHGSVYFDYGTSFNPSAESLSLSVSTTVLPPEENQTYEVGTKWSFLRDRLSLAGALFQTTKDNAKETSPANSTIIVLAGNQRVRGGQVSLTGRLSHEFDFVGGYAYLNSDVIASQFYPNAIGAPLANVPKQTFNVWLNRALGLRFTGGLGGNYVGSRSAKLDHSLCSHGMDGYDTRERRGHGDGTQAGSRLLGFQRHGAAPNLGASFIAGQRQQPAEPLLHR